MLDSGRPLPGRIGPVSADDQVHLKNARSVYDRGQSSEAKSTRPGMFDTGKYFNTIPKLRQPKFKPFFISLYQTMNIGSFWCIYLRIWDKDSSILQKGGAFLHLSKASRQKFNSGQ